jgi:hypothetical protein
VDQTTRNTASDESQDSEDAEPPAVCAACGGRAERLPVTWVCSVEGGVRRHFCDGCARTHLRSIEGRLDSTAW